jgi:hypothetical protein
MSPAKGQGWGKRRVWARLSEDEIAFVESLPGATFSEKMRYAIQQLRDLRQNLLKDLLVLPSPEDYQAIMEALWRRRYGR